MRHSTQNCTQYGHPEISLQCDPNAPDSLDTGWFLGFVDPTHDHNCPTNLRRISLYEAMVKFNPGIVSFLGLPDDVKVLFNVLVPTFERWGKKLPILPDSYLHKKYPGRI